MSPFVVPFQLGRFIEFPNYLGPSIVIVGFLLLVFWFVMYKLLPEFSFQDQYEPGMSILIGWCALSISLGLFLVSTRLVLQANVFWLFTVILFITGRMIEGAIFIRGLQKILSLIRSVFDTGTSSSQTSLPQDLVSKFLWKVIYNGIATVFILVAVLSIGITVATMTDTPTYSTPVMVATYLSTTAVFIFIWDIREIISQLHSLVVAGLTLCLAGTEIYNFPQVKLPIIQSFGRTAQNIYDIFYVEWLSLSVIDVALIFTGHIAFGLGMIIALGFLTSSSSGVASN